MNSIINVYSTTGLRPWLDLEEHVSQDVPDLHNADADRRGRLPRPSRPQGSSQGLTTR